MRALPVQGGVMIGQSVPQANAAVVSTADRTQDGLAASAAACLDQRFRRSGSTMFRLVHSMHSGQSHAGTAAGPGVLWGALTTVRNSCGTRDRARARSKSSATSRRRSRFELQRLIETAARLHDPSGPAQPS